MKISTLIMVPGGEVVRKKPQQDDRRQIDRQNGSGT